MVIVTLAVKWNKNVYQVPVEEGDTGLAFKTVLYSLTNVQPDRQKVMGFKGGVLKDDADLGKLVVGMKDGAPIMMMGTPATEAAQNSVEPPSQKPVFVEDLSTEEMLALDEDSGSGLVNLGNTCYMNATLQCLNMVPELKDDMSLYQVQSNGQDLAENIIVGTRDIFRNLDTRRQKAIQPLLFMKVFRMAYPQFAQVGQDGVPMQQDADDAMNLLLQTFSQRLRDRNTVERLFTGEYKIQLKCQESSDERESISTERFSKLECHIGQQTSNLLFGLKESLEGTLEKRSELLGRSAIYSKHSTLNRLPPYLEVQLVRFFWKPQQKVKAKILKSVTFPFQLDLFDLCSDELKAHIIPNREALRRDKEAKQAAAKAAIVGSPPPEQQQQPASGEAVTPTVSLDTITNTAENQTAWYELCAVLTHQGRTADGGHYVAWTKQDNGSWMKFDDDKVSRIPEDEIRKLSGGGDFHMAYILFYRSKKSDGSIVGPP